MARRTSGGHAVWAASAAIAERTREHRDIPLEKNTKNLRGLSLVCAAGLASAQAGAQVSVGGIAFVDRAARNEITLGTIRGSIGVIDFDNDGWYDLFIADRAGFPHRLFRNVASAGSPGGRSFLDVTVSSGVGDTDGATRCHGGVVVFDYNNDGWSDIYQIGPGPGLTGGLLYRNNGNGTFSNVSVASGVRQTDTNPGSAAAVEHGRVAHSGMGR